MNTNSTTANVETKKESGNSLGVTTTVLLYGGETISFRQAELMKNSTAIETAIQLANLLFRAGTKAFEIKVLRTSASAEAQDLDECIFHYRMKTFSKTSPKPKLQLVA